jgi:hypothetical protein
MLNCLATQPIVSPDPMPTFAGLTNWLSALRVSPSEVRSASRTPRRDQLGRSALCNFYWNVRLILDASIFGRLKPGLRQNIERIGTPVAFRKFAIEHCCRRLGLIANPDRQIHLDKSEERLIDG